MIHLVNYSDANMTISQKKCTESAMKHGVEQYHMFRETDISNEFKLFNKEVWESPRASYWIWKPYIIYDTMLRRCNDGDILIYSDAGIEFIASVNHIIERMDGDFFFFTNGFKNGDWCKGDVLIDMFGDAEELQDAIRSQQIQASLLFFRVNQQTKDFVKKWLVYSQMPGFIDDSRSIWNHLEFQEHRHDQAILTCVAIQSGIDYNNLWPDKIWQNQRHRWPHSTYPPIIIHHRRRNNEY